MMTSDFSKHLTQFLSEYLPNQKNASRNTITSYRDTFKLLIRYCHEQKGIKAEKLSMKHLTNKLIEDFLGYLEIDRKSSISSRNQRLAAIHSFFRYAQYEEPSSLMHFQKIIALPVKKAPKTNIPHLTPEAIKLLLEQPDKTTLKGRRDLTLLCVLYDSGCRVQELADLKVRDIILDKQPVIVLTGKGNKTRRVPLMKNTVLLLETYIQEHKLDKTWKTDYPLFENRQHNKLTKEGISYIIKKYVSIARESSQKIPAKVSPHMFRNHNFYEIQTFTNNYTISVE